MTITEPLSTQIEECLFHTIQVNYDHEAGDGKAIYLVREDQDIAAIGRQLIEAGNSGLQLLDWLTAGRITLVLHNKDDHLVDSQSVMVDIAEIDPKRKCRVLLISPIYLVQFA